MPNLFGSMVRAMTDLYDVGSARTEGDSWDITESVGATALGVAMARAAESDCDCPLFTDRYAVERRVRPACQVSGGADRSARGLADRIA